MIKYKAMCIGLLKDDDELKKLCEICSFSSSSFENLLDEYEHGKNKNDIENDEHNKFNIEVLNNLIRLTNIYLNLKPYIIKNISKIN